MPLRRMDSAAGLTVTYRVVNDETGAEVIASTAAVVDMGGLRYSTATSIPAGQSVEWSIGGVYSYTTDPLPDNAGIAAAQSAAESAANDAASAAQSATLIHGTDFPALGVKVDAIAANVSTDVPLGYTRLTSATYGEYLPGTVIDVFLATDTAEATPIHEPTTVAANGTWHYDVPTGDAYTLVARLAGKRTHRQAVTV